MSRGSEQPGLFPEEVEWDPTRARRVEEYPVPRTLTIPRLPDDKIRNEGHLISLLKPGVYHVSQIEDAVERLQLCDRDDGRGRYDSNNHIKWQHRVANGLQQRRAKGLARSLGDGFWVLDGTLDAPKRAVFVIMGELSDLTLALGAAAKMARQIEEQVDIIFCDPPWQIDMLNTNGRKPGRDRYDRNQDDIVSGYIELEKSASYFDFSSEWISGAAGILRPGGAMCVVTGPDQSGAVQLAGERAGLWQQNSVVIRKPAFVMPTTRRNALSHTRMTVLRKGPKRLDHTYNLLPEMPRAESGKLYPQDVWDDIPLYQRTRLYRYPNQLPPILVDRVVRMYSNQGDLGVDFFSGSGTFPLVCLLRGRRCIASDLNPKAIQFGMGRILDVFAQQNATLNFGGGINDFSRIQLGL